MLNIPRISQHPVLSPYAPRPPSEPAAYAAWPAYHAPVDRHGDRSGCRRSGKEHRDNGDEPPGTISRGRFQMRQVK